MHYATLNLGIDIQLEYEPYIELRLRCCATSKKPGTMQLQYYPCIKRIDSLYFVINELFCNSLIMLLCIAKEALFE